jgi:hypothetical protein
MLTRNTIRVGQHSLTLKHSAVELRHGKRRQNYWEAWEEPESCSLRQPGAAWRLLNLICKNKTTATWCSQHSNIWDVLELSGNKNRQGNNLTGRNWPGSERSRHDTTRLIGNLATQPGLACQHGAITSLAPQQLTQALFGIQTGLYEVPGVGKPVYGDTIPTTTA